MATGGKILLKVPKSTIQVSQPGGGGRIKLLIPSIGGGMKHQREEERRPVPADFHLLHYVAQCEPLLILNILELSYPEREIDPPQFQKLTEWTEMYPDRPVYKQVVYWIYKRMTRLPYHPYPMFIDGHMKRFPALRQFWANRFPLVTPKALLGMPLLTFLAIDFDETKYGDTFIAGLTQLTSLNLSGNRTITREGLRPLTNLRRLELHNNYGVTGFDGHLLQHLSLANNHGFENSSLARHTDLLSLNLADCARFTDQTISGLTALQTLNLASNQVITTDGLRGLTALTELNLMRDTVVTNDGIAPLTNLRSLNLSHNPMITDAGLAPLVQLEHLSLRHNMIITPDGLRPLTALRELNVSMNDRMPATEVMRLIPEHCLVRGLMMTTTTSL